jgi:AmmeMemoRadiSam system protein A
MSNLGPTQRAELHELARASIELALQEGQLMPYAGEPNDSWLNRPSASFVTLRVGEDLRGCCGTIEPSRPLSQDVWNNAWASAFADPRFPPLTSHEWPETNVQISVLSDPERLDVRSEAELLEVLRPGYDGLILQLGQRRSTFLPAVWEQLPEPVRFVRHLKMKAGWPVGFWPPDMEAWRYTTESF